MSKLNWQFSFLLGNVAVGGHALLIPLFIIIVLDGSATDVGLVAGVTSLVGVFTSIFWGRLSDRLMRRKPFILLGFLGGAVMLLLLATVDNIRHVVLLNAGFNLFWMAGVPVAIPLVIEQLDRLQWEEAISKFNRYTGFGWVFGLLLGTIWTTFVTPYFGETTALRSLFIVLGGLSLAAAMIASSCIVEKRDKVTARHFFSLMTTRGSRLMERFRDAPSHLYHLLSWQAVASYLRGSNLFGRKLTLYFYAVLLIFTGFSVFFVPLPVFFRRELGFSSAMIFSINLVPALASAVLYYITGSILRRVGNRMLQLLVLISRILIFPLFYLLALLDFPLYQLVLLALLFIGTGSSWAFFNVASTALVSQLANGETKGQALGVFNALAAGGWIIGALIGGAVAESFGFLAAFVAGSVILLIVIPIVVFPLEK
ncbi:MFS transporter [Candidatus Acetothermia bacterium]|nr:MFS transporter [Candidatus Acetothermia bacterium]